MDSVNSIEDIYSEIGGFGWFQLFSTFFIFYPEFSSGMLEILPVYIGRVPEDWVCQEDETFFPPLHSSTVNGSEICSCNGTLYGGDSSIVSEWNLICGRDWIVDSITSVQMAGLLIGGLVGAKISDSIGRKKTFFFACLGIFVGASTYGFVNSPFMFAATTFLVGSCISAYMVVNAFYPMEFLPANARTLSGAVGPWGEGVMFLALFSYFFQPWRTLTKITALPILIVFISLPFLPESPRWLLQKNRDAEAKVVFDQIARWNGRPSVDIKTVERLGHKIRGTEGEIAFQLLHIIKNRNLRGKLLIFSTAWFSVSILYYAITFNTKNIGGDLFLNIFYTGLMDSIGYRSAIFSNHLFGRRKAYAFYMTISSSSFLVIMLMNLNMGIPYNESWVNALSIFTKLFICGAWSAIKCFTAESFPTSARSSAIGFTTICSGFGAIIAPQLVFLGTMYKAGPFFILGILAILSTGLSLLLTETKGKPIGETLEEEASN